MAGSPAAHMPRDHRYRPDIDGLRALSILLVVAFHAELPWFEGGFVGVDVFFVISGYLITGLLVAEAQKTGGIAIGQFFARRIRRLLPLAAAVAMATLAAGWWLLPPLARSTLLADVRGAALYFANWRYALVGEAYTDTEVTDSLLLHYWSLAVEEQFYVLWPLLILAVAWLTRKHSARFVPAVSGLIAVVIGLSLWASVTVTAQSAPMGYYGSHTRFWEMGVGAALALVLPRMRRISPGVALVVAGTGVIAIVWSAMSYGPTTVFPGTAALVPVLGTAAVIAAGAQQRTPVGQVLGTAPMTYLGRVSYAWYLWHWPVIGLALIAADQAGGEYSRPGVIATAVVGSLLLAVASHHVVENPLRYTAWLRRPRRRSFALGASLTTIPVVSVLLLAAFGNTGGQQIVMAEPEPTELVQPPDTDNPGDPSPSPTGETPDTDPPVESEELDEPSGPDRPPSEPDEPEPDEPEPDEPEPDEPEPDEPQGDEPEPEDDEPAPTPTPSATPPVQAMSPEEAAEDFATVPDDECRSLDPGAPVPPECALGDADAETTVAVMGDSHAEHWAPALDEAGQEQGWRVLMLTRSSCAPIDVPLWVERLGREYTECSDFRTQVYEGLAGEESVDVMILARSYQYAPLVVNAEGEHVAPGQVPVEWQAGAERTFDHLADTVDRVVVFRDTPWSETDVPTCLSDSPEDPSECGLDLEQSAGLDEELVAAEQTVAGSDVTYLDPTELVCDGDPCQMVTDEGVIKYRDRHHLTATYARSLGPAFGEWLAPVVDDAEEDAGEDQDEGSAEAEEG